MPPEDYEEILSLKYIAKCALKVESPFSLAKDVYPLGRENETSLKRQLHYINQKWLGRPLVHARWLGAAGVEFRFDHQLFLVDPYLTRTVSISDVLTGGSAKVRAEENILPITDYINNIKANNTPIQAILIGHTHWDHAADVPLIQDEHQRHFSLTPIAWGSSSLRNLLKHYYAEDCMPFKEAGLASPRLEGPTYSLYKNMHDTMSVEMTPYLAEHTSRLKFAGDISKDDKPEKIKDYRCGTMLAYKLKFKECHKVITVYVGPACNHPGLSTIKKPGEVIDVAFLSVSDWITIRRDSADEQKGIQKIVEFLRPVSIVPIHFDDALTKLPDTPSPINPWRVPEDIPYGFYFGIGLTGINDENAEEEFRRFKIEISDKAKLKVPRMFTYFPVVSQC